MTSIYESGFSPRGVPTKNVERISMCESGDGQAGDIMRRYGIPESWGDPADALGFFADNGDGSLICLVADYGNGKRATYRRLARSSKMTISNMQESQA